MNIGMNIDISSNMSMGTNTDMRHTKFAKCRVRICDYIYEGKKTISKNIILNCII